MQAQKVEFNILYHNKFVLRKEQTVCHVETHVTCEWPLFNLQVRDFLVRRGPVRAVHFHVWKEEGWRAYTHKLQYLYVSKLFIIKCGYNLGTAWTECIENGLYCVYLNWKPLKKCLKGTVARDIFTTVFFHELTPYGPLIHTLKYFRIRFQIRGDILNQCCQIQR